MSEAETEPEALETPDARGNEAGETVTTNGAVRTAPPRHRPGRCSFLPLPSGFALQGAGSFADVCPLP